MKTCLIALLSLTLIACAGSAPRINPAQLTALQKGQTTIDEVVRQFGRPSVLSKNPDGTQSAIYLHDGNAQSGTAMVPLLASTHVDSTTFYFDPKGVLTDYKFKQASSDKPAPAASSMPAPAEAAKPTAAQTTATKPASGGVNSMRWPGSTTENR